MTGEPQQPPAPPSTPPLPPAPAPEPRAQRLVRRRDDRIIGGVASGVADYLDADPSLVRIGWVALAILTSGLGVLAYLAAWALIPEEGGATGDSTASGGQPREGRARRDRGPWGGVIFGGVLIALGGIALLSQLDLPTPPWRVILAGLLVLVGPGIVVSARRGLNGGLLILAIVLTGVLASGSGVPLGRVDSGFGDRRVVLDAPGQLEHDYGHAFGSMRIDLADSALAAGTTQLRANIAFGDLRITVPAGVGVRVTATTAFGSTRVLDEESGAFGDREFRTPGYEQASKRLEVDVNTAFGATRVSRGAP